MQILIKHLSFQTTTDPNPTTVEGDAATISTVVNSPAPTSPQTINEFPDPPEITPIDQSVQEEVPSIPAKTIEPNSTTATSSIKSSQPELTTSMISLEQPLTTSTEIVSIKAPQHIQVASTQNILRLPQATPPIPPSAVRASSAGSPQYQIPEEVLDMKYQNQMDALRMLQ